MDSESYQAMKIKVFRCLFMIPLLNLIASMDTLFSSLLVRNVLLCSVGYLGSDEILLQTHLSWIFDGKIKFRLEHQDYCAFLTRTSNISYK